MSKFRIEITSVPDRENLVAEIWFSENLIAEINQEQDEFEIELYSNQKLTLKFDDFVRTLEVAKKKLTE